MESVAFLANTLVEVPVGVAVLFLGNKLHPLRSFTSPRQQLLLHLWSCAALSLGCISYFAAKIKDGNEVKTGLAVALLVYHLGAMKLYKDKLGLPAVATHGTLIALFLYYLFSFGRLHHLLP